MILIKDERKNKENHYLSASEKEFIKKKRGIPLS